LDCFGCVWGASLPRSLAAVKKIMTAGCAASGVLVAGFCIIVCGARGASGAESETEIEERKS